MITLSYQENYQILVFGYVFKAKFKNQSPEDYFRQTAAKPVLKLLQYYRQYPELPTGLDDYPPDDSSSLEDQLIYVLRSNDARFKSNVIRRFNVMDNDKVNDYVSANFDNFWKKYDNNGTGEIYESEGETFLRALLGPNNRFRLAPGALSDMDSTAQIHQNQFSTTPDI